MGSCRRSSSFMCVDAADRLAQLTHRTAQPQSARVAAARVGSFAGDDQDSRELLPILSSPTDNCSRSSAATHCRSTSASPTRAPGCPSCSPPQGGPRSTASASPPPTRSSRSSRSSSPPSSSSKSSTLCSRTRSRCTRSGTSSWPSSTGTSAVALNAELRVSLFNLFARQLFVLRRMLSCACLGVA